MFILMRSLTLLLLLAVSTVNVAASQSAKVSVNLRGASVDALFQELEKTTDYSFIYNLSDVERLGKRDYVVRDMELETVLKTCLEGTPLEYTIRDRHVIINARETFQQPAVQNVTGIVRDKSGAPMTGVTVSVKGTTAGAVTDSNGHFTIRALTSGEVLVFSNVGKQTLEVRYEGQRNLDVMMVDSVTEMEEVVVTGMFTRNAQTYTGSVTTIGKEQLLRGGNQNVIASITNVEPSLLMIENLASGSDPNATHSLMLRGQSTIEDVNNQYVSDPNQPLFILDGFETTYQKIRDLDINLVESVTILKDATAKAIYGAKAANGVIVVETRRPEGGQIRISYTADLNIEMPDLTSYNLTNAAEKLRAEWLAGFYTTESVSGQIALDQKYAQLTNEILAGVDTDWLSQPLRTGVGHKHSIYLEGGDAYMLYGVDLSYNNIQGIMKGSSRETFSGGVSLTYRTGKLLFRNKLSIDHNTANDSPWGDFSQYAQLNPYNRLYDVNGGYIKAYSYSIGGDKTEEEPNPIYNTLINTLKRSKYTDITENFYAEWNITTDLKFVTRFGLTYRLESGDDFRPANHTDFVKYTDVTRKGSYSKTEGKTFNLSGDVGASHSFVSGDHVLNSNVMLNVTDMSYDMYGMTAEGFPNDYMDHVSFATQYLKDGSPWGSENRSRTVGGILSANYAYDNRYLFDVNYRLTGSSEAGANNRWGHFWSVGGGWNVHNEEFLKDNGFLTRLKLRASVGYTGSQGFNTYDAIATFKYYTTASYNGNIGSYLVSLANPDLRWQSKYDRNVGLDFTILNNKLSGRFDYYWATTESMLVNVTLPQSTGFGTYRENLGETLNQGWEASLTWRVWENGARKSFVNVNASAAHNKNTLKKISQSLRSYNEARDKVKDAADNADTKLEQITPSVRYSEGESMNAIWAVRSLGIDPVTGREIYQRPDGTVTYEWRSADQVVCGDMMPKVNGNFGINAEYMNFGLNVQFTYRLGGQMYNETLVQKVENADIAHNVDERVLYERWQNVGDKARFKSIADQTLTRPTSRFVEDYNLLKLATVSFSYDFRDHRFMEDSFVRRLRLSLFMNDIATISSVRNERGTSYPFSRNISFSVQASF